MEINEQTNIQPEQSNQFMPRTKFNIPKSTIQKVKSTITSLNSGLVVSQNFSTSASTPYSFVINPNNQTVIDLSQCYFNVAGKFKVPDGYNGIIDTRNIKFGNLFLSSLFQQFSLSIGGSVVALNANPGIDANIQAALKFDSYDLINKNVSNRQFLMNKISQDFGPSTVTPDFAAGTFKWFWAAGATVAVSSSSPQPAYANLSLEYHGAAINIGTSTNDHLTCTDLIMTFNDGGVATVVAKGLAGELAAAGSTEGLNSDRINTTQFKVYGLKDNYQQAETDITPFFTTANTENGKYIPFRCKFYLSDMFNYTVDSLDYIFNREINITLQRGSTSFIIANVNGASSTCDTKLEVFSMEKFELVCFSYLLTDTARQQLLAYYSRPVETLFGVQTTNLTPLYNTEPNAEQNITLPLTVNFDTKCILLAFPKCSNALQPLSTGSNFTLDKVASDSTTNDHIQASWWGSNSNSYNFAGLKYIRISNTSNSNIYTYDFNGTAESPVLLNYLVKSYDYTNAPSTDNAPASVLDYREAYSQFKQIRLLFGKDPDNGIGYYDYLKDYCVIPIDLTGSNIPPNTRIFITFQFAAWGTNWNPLCLGNLKGNKKLTTNILAVFLGSDVLQYNPDGTCIVKHILTAGTNEKGVNIK
jgi:hypothetical protein